MAKMVARIFNAVAEQVVRWVGAFVIAAGISARSVMA